MAKIIEYPRIVKLKDNDLFLVDGPDGTRTILQTDAAKQMGGEVIMVNEQAGESTKVVIETTDEKIHLATMEDLEPVEGDVEELKTQLIETNDGIESIGFIGSFAIGGLNQDGTLNSNQKYRVSSNSHIILDYSTRITCKQGYKWGYIPFIENVPGAWYGWYTNTDEIYLPAGTEFVVQIALVPETQVTVTDINPFITSILTRTKLESRIETNSGKILELEYLSHTLNEYDIKVGTISDSGTVDYNSPKRFLTDEFIQLKNINKIINKNNGLYHFGIHYYNSNFSHIDNTEWLTVDEYNIPNNNNYEYMKLVFRRINNPVLTEVDKQAVIDSFILIGEKTQTVLDLVLETKTVTLIPVGGTHPGTEVTYKVGYIDTDGNYHGSNGYSLTDFIDLGVNPIINADIKGYPTIASIAFYKADKTFISGIIAATAGGAISGVQEIPSNAVYVRFTLTNAYASGYIDFTSTGRYSTKEVNDAKTELRSEIAQNTEKINTNETEFRSEIAQNIEKYDAVTNFANNGIETFYTHGTFQVGGLNVDGTLLPSQKTRVSNTDKISFSRDITVKVKSGFKWGYIPFTNDVPGTWSGWFTTDTVITAGTEFVVQISKDPEGSAEANVYEYVCALTFNSLVGDNLSQTGSVSYFGELMPSRKGSFNHRKLFTMETIQGGVSQDTEVYGNYLFVCFSGTEQIKVYSLTDYSQVAAMTVAVNHGSQMQFSNEFYDENDGFPLLYVGGWTDNIINIIRFTISNDVWSATVVKRLYIPTTNGYYLAPTLDNYNHILYCFGNKLSTIAEAGNKNVIVKCDLSNLMDNGNDTYTPAVIDRKEIPWVGVFQGGKYYNGRLYIGFANTTSPTNSRIVIINPDNGEIRTDIDMTAVTAGECEGLSYRIVNSDILWIFSDYWNVYQLHFYG